MVVPPLLIPLLMFSPMVMRLSDDVHNIISSLRSMKDKLRPELMQPLKEGDSDMMKPINFKLRMGSQEFHIFGPIDEKQTSVNEIGLSVTKSGRVKPDKENTSKMSNNPASQKKDDSNNDGLIPDSKEKSQRIQKAKLHPSFEDVFRYNLPSKDLLSGIMSNIGNVEGESNIEETSDLLGNQEPNVDNDQLDRLYQASRSSDEPSGYVTKLQESVAKLGVTKSDSPSARVHKQKINSDVMLFGDIHNRSFLRPPSNNASTESINKQVDKFLAATPGTTSADILESTDKHHKEKAKQSFDEIFKPLLNIFEQDSKGELSLKRRTTVNPGVGKLENEDILDPSVKVEVKPEESSQDTTSRTSKPDLGLLPVLLDAALKAKRISPIVTQNSDLSSISSQEQTTESSLMIEIGQFTSSIKESVNDMSTANGTIFSMKIMFPTIAPPMYFITPFFKKLFPKKPSAISSRATALSSDQNSITSTVSTSKDNTISPPSEERNETLDTGAPSQNASSSTLVTTMLSTSTIAVLKTSPSTLETSPVSSVTLRPSSTVTPKVILDKLKNAGLLITPREKAIVPHIFLKPNTSLIVGSSGKSRSSDKDLGLDSNATNVAIAIPDKATNISLGERPIVDIGEIPILGLGSVSNLSKIMSQNTNNLLQEGKGKVLISNADTISNLSTPKSKTVKAKAEKPQMENIPEVNGSVPEVAAEFKQPQNVTYVFTAISSTTNRSIDANILQAVTDLLEPAAQDIYPVGKATNPVAKFPTMKSVALLHKTRSTLSGKETITDVNALKVSPEKKYMNIKGAKLKLVDSDTILGGTSLVNKIKSTRGITFFEGKGFTDVKKTTKSSLSAVNVGTTLKMKRRIGLRKDTPNIIEPPNLESMLFETQSSVNKSLIKSEIAPGKENQTGITDNNSATSNKNQNSNLLNETLLGLPIAEKIPTVKSEIFPGKVKLPNLTYRNSSTSNKFDNSVVLNDDKLPRAENVALIKYEIIPGKAKKTSDIAYKSSDVSNIAQNSIVSSNDVFDPPIIEDTELIKSEIAPGEVKLNNITQKKYLTSNKDENVLVEKSSGSPIGAKVPLNKFGIDLKKAKLPGMSNTNSSTPNAVKNSNISNGDLVESAITGNAQQINSDIAPEEPKPSGASNKTSATDPIASVFGRIDKSPISGAIDIPTKNNPPIPNPEQLEHTLNEALRVISEINANKTSN